jgi:predicted secreted protein
MKDEKKPILLAISHCLLNPNVRAEGLSRHPEIKNKILKFAEKYNAKIKQLPCPEFSFLGKREPKTYDEYIQIPGFKEFCEKLAEDFVNNIEKNEDYYTVVVGIARSPSCSVCWVYDKNNNLKKGEGVLIHFLRKKIKAAFMEIDYHEIDSSIQRVEEILKSVQIF